MTQPNMFELDLWTQRRESVMTPATPPSQNQNQESNEDDDDDDSVRSPPHKRFRKSEELPNKPYDPERWVEAKFH